MSMYPKTNLRLIYLLNNEGYGLLDRENPLYNTSIDDPEAKGRYESITFLMTLSSDTNNNQYLISISKSYRLMEIYDLKSNQIYFNKAEDIFNDLKAIYSIVGTYLRLKNNENVYIIGLLAYDKNDVSLLPL